MMVDAGEVYVFKLTTGEETVARVELIEYEDGDDNQIINKYYIIKQPINAIITAQGLQLMPGLFTANPDKLVELNNSCIAMIAIPREDIRMSYIQATTGIAPISKQIITG